MRAYRVPTLLLSLVVAAAAVGADGPIRVPVAPPVPQPMPAPPAPDAAVRLAGDMLYVVDSDQPVIVLASPKGLVSISEEVGPIKVRGRFVGGTGLVETKTFKGKHVVTVEALGTGRVELLVVPVGAAKEADVIRRTLDVDSGLGPIPPPQPKPDPKPEPKPQPDPAADPVLVKKFADAMTKDSANKAHVAALAKVYTSAAAILEGGDPAAKPATYGGLIEVMTSSSIAAGVPRLPALESLRTEVSAALPEADARAALTGDLLASVVAGYKRVGAALAAAAK